jgi:non-ribosomal peptide synthetase component E (peptide arylation enzyme)
MVDRRRRRTGLALEAAGLDFTKFSVMGAAHGMQQAYDYGSDARHQPHGEVFTPAQERPGHIAIVDSALRITYATLDVATGRVAAAPQRDGFAAGDRAAILAATSAPPIRMSLLQNGSIA